MTKGPTKAQLALAEAREWIEASKMEVGEREKALTEARSQLEMHETIYAILEKTFTRQPGKTTTKKASKKSSKSAGKSARAQGLSKAVRGSLQRRVPTGATGDDDETMQQACVFKNGDYNCGLGVDSPVHRPDGGYAGYHPFVSPSPARNAGGRSSSRNSSQSAAARDTQKTAPSSPSEKHEPGENASSSPVNSEVVRESVSSATGD